MIDISKAFDTVNHCVLLGKMEMCGVKGTAFDLFKSYLFDRKQYVRMGSTSSSITTSNIGIPK